MTPEQAAEKYHWVKYDKNTNTVELYLDNFMLSSARLCEAKFYLEHMLWIKPRYNRELRKPWFFDFGEYIHWCLELFYEGYKKTNNPPVIAEWLDKCKTKWAMMKMDEYKDSVIEADRKKYDEIKGWEGVASLLVQYYAFYIDLRVRVVDTEITFGHNKEVHIGKVYLHQYNEDADDFETLGINCYLTGRIDLLVDNGYKVGPVDHKTTAKFDGFEHNDFNPHDGMTGYILAVNEILARYRERGLTKLPVSGGGWIYHISSLMPSVPRDKAKQQQPRFKTTPIDKTSEQLSDYKARQLSTYKRIAELLFNNKVPEWNTTACNNIFFRPCEYKSIHEQPSSQWQHMITQFYEITTPWDTRLHGSKSDASDKEKSQSAKVDGDVKSIG